MADRPQRASPTVPAMVRGLAYAMLALAACAPGNGRDEGEAGPLPRAGRFGSLRDFVLVRLPPSPPEMPRRLFVDRFEVTRGDWADFAATSAGEAVAADSAAMLGDRALPVGLVDLRQARAFAAWRFARLPMRDEWFAAALGDGRNRFPWGNKADATRANTKELGLLEPTLVGTFESGRRGLGPYDLIGNVSEWTETVAAGWCQLEDAVDPLSLPAPFAAARRGVLAAAGLAVWQPGPGIVPAVAAIAAASDSVPREVVGADFQRAMQDPVEPHPGTELFGPRLVPARLVEYVPGGDRRDRTGLRLFATPAALVRALVVADVVPTAADYEQLQRFVERDGHLPVLREAWSAVVRELAAADLDRPLARWLQQRLGA